MGIFDGLGKYRVIYADPPWAYKDKANAGNRGACYKYPVMNLRDICKMPVVDLAADDCLLAMWYVNPMPCEALQVVESWGFTLKTMTGLTWVKSTKHGKTFWGMGNWTRQNVENCLFAVRGRPQRVNKGVHHLINSPIGRHSEKPAEARLKLEKLMGDVPRIELFARQRVTGWDAWGNEV